jgi:hypothetical protein
MPIGLLLFVPAGILFFISSIQQQAAIVFGVPPNFLKVFFSSEILKEILNLKRSRCARATSQMILPSAISFAN